MIFGRRKDLDETLDEIEAALDAGERDEAVVLARKATRRFPDSPDALGLLGEALEGARDPAGAVRAYQAAFDLDPAWAGAMARIASIEIEAGDLGAAREHIRKAVEIDAGDPDASWVRGILAEIDGRPREARERYREAARKDPDRFSDPVRVSLEDFRAMAASAVDDLPDEVRAFLGDVPIIIEDMPERDGEGGFSNGAPLLLGECVGSHLTDRGAMDATSGVPSRIVLYKTNLERECATREDLEEEIRITVLHEVLHWLGLDEEEVAGRGLE